MNRNTWDSYTWRQKVRALWMAGAVFLLLVYQLSVKPTLRLREQYQAGLRDRVNAEENRQTLRDLQKKWQESAGAFSGPHPQAVFSSEKETLSFLADTNSVTVLALPEPAQYDEGNFHLFLVASQYEGSFHNLLALLHSVEKSPDVQLLNAAFTSRTNPISRMRELHLDLNTYSISIDDEHEKKP